MEEKKNAEIIDLRIALKKVIGKKKLFFLTLPIAFILASVIIVSVPRTYTCQIMLVPEMTNQSAGGTLSSLASAFGFDFGSAMTTDAISPPLYPDLLESTDFVIGLFHVRVKNVKGDIDTDYYTYLQKHQQSAWWKYPIIWIKRQVGKMLVQEDSQPISQEENSSASFMLSKNDHEIIETIQDRISCSIDKKTNVISITVVDQDRLICATMADSVRVRLQDAITEYRTNKSRIDMNYYDQLTTNAKAEYDEAREAYSRMFDANRNIIMQSVQSQIDNLENDMQVKFNTYTAMNTQYQAAKAKVQERTPAFTILQGASVPVKATGPKRMFFVLSVLFLTFIGTVFYILKEDLKNAIKVSQ